MEIKNKLTPRQWRLLDYLKEHGKSSLLDIASALDYEVSLKGHDKCIDLRNDADAITKSPETEKIVLRDKRNNYWLATAQSETVEFAKNRYFYPAMRKLQKYYSIIEKAKLNGQVKIFSLKGDVIDDDSQARRFVEAYVGATND